MIKSALVWRTWRWCSKSKSLKSLLRRTYLFPSMDRPLYSHIFNTFNISTCLLGMVTSTIWQNEKLAIYRFECETHAPSCNTRSHNQNKTHMFQPKPVPRRGINWERENLILQTIYSFEIRNFAWLVKRPVIIARPKQLIYKSGGVNNAKSEIK